MKKANIAMLALLALWAGPCLGAETRSSWQQSPPPINEQNPQAAILEAEKRFEAAEKDFTRAENAEAAQAFGKNQKPAQSETKKPEAQKPAQPAQTGDPREQALQGTPETGYSGTWTDPATGDIITSVIAPTPQPVWNQAQNYPIIIEPQVAAGSWTGSASNSDWGNTWQPDWSGGQGNQWGGSNWPQWPGYPGDSGGYPPPPPPPPPGVNKPWPGMNQHWPGMRPMAPTQVPNNPVPPFPPGYRPLRPTPVQGGWQPGYAPPANGLNPPGTPNIPGYNSPPWGNGRPLGYNPLNQPPAQPNPGGNPFPVNPGNPGLQPQPGPMPNGPAPGFRAPTGMPPGGGF